MGMGKSANTLVALLPLAVPAPVAVPDAALTAPDNGDIVVTARRRAEGPQKVPIAIATFSGT